MTLQIALLRAVNVGGTGKVAMVDLRSCLAVHGFPGAKTILQSGNIILDSKGIAGAALEDKLEAAFEIQLKLRSDVIVRSADQWAAAIANNPMKAEARSDPSHLLLMLGKRPVASSRIDALKALITEKSGREMVQMNAGTVYMFFPDGIGSSRITSKSIERALGTSVTGRNWNTVLKIRDAL